MRERLGRGASPSRSRLSGPQVETAENSDEPVAGQCGYAMHPWLCAGRVAKWT